MGISSKARSYFSTTMMNLWCELKVITDMIFQWAYQRKSDTFDGKAFDGSATFDGQIM
jgi:hypothetical protein